MELSKRLSAVAGLVTEGASAADIGTDHGYVPIYLAEVKKSPHVIAMDVNPGPLERAREHIREHGLQGLIEVRRSDGLKNLKAGEAETAIFAGMGGNLIISILEASPLAVREVKELILQPQSDIHRVRKYLNQQGFLLTAEDMVEEDGKFYPAMKLVHGREAAYSEEELYYGRLLLQGRHPVLYRFLLREQGRKERILAELSGRQGERIFLRRWELQGELARIGRALGLYGQSKGQERKE